MKYPLVSIIIPTYNRSALLGETLESVIQQTYNNWECIVVDDGSLDTTSELMEFYCEKEKRIRYISRPTNLPKGANSCRNFGFDVSKGEYINWFDSDDLMLPNNLELKLIAFKKEIDFVIGNSLNFDEKGNNSRPYKLNYDEEISPENFITGKIGWITNDVLIRRDKVLIKFNEALSSGQEYNFFSRLLYFSSKGRFLKEDTVLRRIHVESIQQILERNAQDKYQRLFENEYQLIKDLKFLASRKILKRSFKRVIRFSFQTSNKFSIKKNQFQVLYLLISHGKISSVIIYMLWIISNFTLGRGYKFLMKVN